MAERAAFERARRELSFAHERNTSLCGPFLGALPVAGVAVSLLSGPIGQSTVCASDATAARLDELQFDLGEGPCWQALATRRPVLTPDLRGEPHPAWPVFAEALGRDARSGEVAAMFAFPLVVGSLGIGAVDLYTTATGELSKTQVADASALASVTAWQVLRRVLGEAPIESLDADGERSSRREVHQATGMVLAQLDITAAEAALLLRAHAFSTGRSVRDFATDVVERRLDFSRTE